MDTTDRMASHDGAGTDEVLDVVSTLESSGIACCVVGTQALCHYGAGRLALEWEICVPSALLGIATALFTEGPTSVSYAISTPPQHLIGSLLHTRPCFKRRGVDFCFSLAPAEDDYHLTCDIIERDARGIPFPGLAALARSLLEAHNDVDLADLVDGADLSANWGDEKLSLDRPLDEEWVRAKNARILASGSFMTMSTSKVDVRTKFVEIVNRKKSRIGPEQSRARKRSTRFRHGTAPSEMKPQKDGLLDA